MATNTKKNTRVCVSATGQSARSKAKKVHFQESTFSVQPHDPLDLATLEKAMEHLVDPVTDSPSLNKKVIGVPQSYEKKLREL